MSHWLGRLLLVLLVLLGLALAGMASAGTVCQTPQLDLGSRAWLLEDPEGRLSADQVFELPDSAFTPGTGRHLVLRYSHSVFWLRLTLAGDAVQDCGRWLTVGDPRLTDIQVHLRQGADHQSMRAGAAYPLAQWPMPARQPTFPLVVPAGQELTLLVRVASSSMIIITPQLWSELGLLEDRQQRSLADGMVLGITLLMVPFSFVVGWILRSRLLVAHALSVFFYALVVSAVNGYLVHVPSLLPWSQEVLWVLGLVQYLLFVAYIRVLLHVGRLPRPWYHAYNLFMLAVAACYLWMLVDMVAGRAAQDALRWVAYVLIAASFLAGWRRGFPYNWLVYLVCGLLVFQGLIRLLSVTVLPWQTADDRLSLTSTLPGLLLLACTLVMEVSRVRYRERRALADLDSQQKAEHERLESTVAMRTEQLRESLRARSLLMARISHDLRSPLVSIVNYARLLSADSRQDYPRKIERNARQQLELIDELLEFSRGELHQLEITLAPGYLFGFLKEMEEEGGFLAAQQDNGFECRLDASLPALVQADFRRLRQVLINLLANAAKFTRNGQVLFEVKCLACDGQTARLRFSVNDSGIGIPPDERKQLQQPFWRGRAAGRYAGSGLGLSIVGQLLHQMDSRLCIDEAPPRGSRFSFEVVFALASEEDLDLSFAEASPLQVSGAGRRILLVDDVEQNREWLSDLLGGYGFDISVAEDARQALEHLAREPCDLLISDQKMPGMDGWALLASVRARWPALPALLYSSAPPQRPAECAGDLAFDAVLLKPSDATRLLSTIDRLAAGAAPSSGVAAQPSSVAAQSSGVGARSPGIAAQSPGIAPIAGDDRVSAD